MRACVRKVEWISVEGKVPSGLREFMPAEVPLVTVEAGSPFRRIGEEVTWCIKMSQNLGSKLPDKTFNSLKFSNETRTNSAIFLLTKDGESFPHVALLSPYQVVAVNRVKLLVAVHSASRSCAFLASDGKGTLILQLEPAVQYVKCRFSESDDKGYSSGEYGEKLFNATPLEILEDYSDKAPFVSELRFDETNTYGPYSEGFGRLKKIAEEDTGRE